MKKKSALITTFAILWLAGIICLIIFIYANSKGVRANKALNLGSRYLLEMEYDQAIACFDKVIEIDPMSVEAYLGKYEAYLAMGDLENAAVVLYVGIEATNDTKLRDTYENFLKEHIVEICDVSEQGIIAHKLSDGDCSDSKKCVVCGYDSGEFGEHDLAPATYADGPKCRKCGKIIGDSLFVGDLKKGDIITFGSYEQDNDLTNGKEPIEWYVIDNNGSEVTLLSVYNLDCQPYNTVNQSVKWESCSLRTWLNDDFYNSAFNEDEQSIINTTRNTNNNNPIWNIDGGKSTEDKIYLLSMGDIENYFGIPMTYSSNPFSGHELSFIDYGIYCYNCYNGIIAKNTEYAIAMGAYGNRDGFIGVDDDSNPIYADYVVGCGEWWLRSPSVDDVYVDASFAAGVLDDGTVYYVYTNGAYCFDEFLVNMRKGVRPSLKIGY